MLKSGINSVRPYILITIFVISFYYPTFSGEFLLDDIPFIKNNSYIKMTPSISSFLFQEDGIPDQKDFKDYHTGYYRPLINLTYWLDYRLWGMQASGFRVTNIVFHLISCFLLFRLTEKLIKEKNAAFFSTLLFALHPANTESVAWVISRNNILVTIFILISLLFYINGQEKDSPASRYLAVLSFGCALFSKEFGVMVLPVIFLYNRLLMRPKPVFTKEIKGYIPFILILIIYFCLRKTVIDSLLTPSEMEGFWSRLYYVPFLILWNLRLIFFPYGLHSFIINYPVSLLNWQAVSSFAIVFIIGTVLWLKRPPKLIIFSVLSAFICMLPVLHIIPTASITLIAMRWLYLPVAFLSISIACLAKKSIIYKRDLTISCLLLVSLYFGSYTYVLTMQLWRNEDSFIQQEVYKFKNYRLAGDLAEDLFKKKSYLEAEKCYRLAIKTSPQRAYNYNNYAGFLIEAGRSGEALKLLDKARPLTMIHREQGQWYNNRGMACYVLQDIPEAIKNFKKAVCFCPEKTMFWANLGGAYGAMGNYSGSVEAIKQGLSIKKDSQSLMENLAVTYMRMGDYQKVISFIEGIPLIDRKKNDKLRNLLNLAAGKLSENIAR